MTMTSWKSIIMGVKSCQASVLYNAQNNSTMQGWSAEPHQYLTACPSHQGARFVKYTIESTLTISSIITVLQNDELIWDGKN